MTNCKHCNHSIHFGMCTGRNGQTANPCPCIHTTLPKNDKELKVFINSAKAEGIDIAIASLIQDLSVDMELLMRMNPNSEEYKNVTLLTQSKDNLITELVSIADGLRQEK